MQSETLDAVRRTLDEHDAWKRVAARIAERFHWSGELEGWVATLSKQLSSSGRNRFPAEVLDIVAEETGRNPLGSLLEEAAARGRLERELARQPAVRIESHRPRARRAS